MKQIHRWLFLYVVLITLALAYLQAADTDVIRESLAECKLPHGNTMVPEQGSPDGMKLDAKGNVYCTGPGGIWICSPNAAVLGRIRMPEVTANLGWGDDDTRTLYITASTSLYRLRCLMGG